MVADNELPNLLKSRLSFSKKLRLQRMIIHHVLYFLKFINLALRGLEPLSLLGWHPAKAGAKIQQVF
jgi:hypothetical protein